MRDALKFLTPKRSNGAKPVFKVYRGDDVQIRAAATADADLAARDAGEVG